jgi:hypothetical protein
MDTHEHEELPRLERLKAQLEALNAKYEQTAADPLAAHEHQAQMAEMARINASLQQTQAALDPATLKTTVAQVRRWAAEETHPNWFRAAYADLAQRRTRVEDRLDEMADSLRMMLGQLAALERQDDQEPSAEEPMDHHAFARRMAETDQLLAQTRLRLEEPLMHTPPPWPERFLAALVPSDRGMVLFLLAMVFACGVIAGLTLATTREIDRRVSQVHQRSGPTLSQRLDALEQRLQALEQRQTPSP